MSSGPPRSARNAVHGAQVSRPAPAMMSIDDVAARWAVSARTVYKMIDRGELHAVKVGRLLRVPTAVVASYEQASVAPGSNSCR